MRCRACGANISSDARRTRCSCGELFPLACSVCEKPLRPPLLVYPDERHLDADMNPLCETHYQRQCPDCGEWFRADTNPGFFRCATCAAKPRPTFETSEVEDEVEDEAPVGATAVAPAPARTKRKASVAKPKSALMPALVFGAIILCGVLGFLHSLLSR